jgi:hypothetical protein
MIVCWGIEDAPVPSGWVTAWRIVGWLILAGALGIALGSMLVALVLLGRL